MNDSMKVPYRGQSVNVHKILSILLFLFIQTFVFGQFAEYNTGVYEDEWNDVVVDSDGNIYAVGTFLHSTAIDGISISNNVPLAATKTQFMVAKYNPNGNLLWKTHGVSPCPNDNIGWSTGTRIAIGEGTDQIFISGEHAGMSIKDPFVVTPIDDLPINNIPCLGSDLNRKPYIISLNRMNGSYNNNFTIPTRGIVTSMVVADNGTYNNYLYASSYDDIDYQSSVYRMDPSTLALSGGNAIIRTTITGIDHIINDIKYENEKIYCVGTTDGSIQFAGVPLTIGLAPGDFTAWTAIINNPSGSISVGSMNHGGTGGKMSGLQIYADNQNNLVIAGLYADLLLFPFNSPQVYSSLSSNGLKNAYLMKLNKNNLISNDVIHTIETTTSQYNVKKVWLTGTDYNVFLSLQYTGRLLYFMPFTGAVINLGSPIFSNYGSKIAVVSYKITPSLNREWHNTTYGSAGTNDFGYAYGNVVYQDLIYTVGQVKERMYFNYLPTLNSTISTGSVKKALVIRNDHSWTGGNGGFKSDDGKENMHSEKKDLSIYPNPSIGDFYINGVNNEDNIEVFDLLGKSLSFVLTFSENKAYIEIESPASMVLVKVNGIGYQVMINE